jgi:hypothetical protein
MFHSPDDHGGHRRLGFSRLSAESDLDLSTLEDQKELDLKSPNDYLLVHKRTIDNIEVRHATPRRVTPRHDTSHGTVTSRQRATHQHTP